MSRHELISTGDEETLAIGREIGAVLPKGTFIALTGDRFVGNTMLVRGFACGLQVPGWAALSRPSFRLMHSYHGGRCILQHIDFYHLNEAPELPTGVQEALYSPDNICVVEWADVARDLWPKQSVIEIHVTVTDDHRRLDVIEDKHGICPELGQHVARWSATVP